MIDTSVNPAIASASSDDGTRTTDDHAVVVAVEALLVSGPDAGRLLGISARQFRRLESSGQIGPLALRIGARSKRFSVAELRRWIEAGCPARQCWDSMKDAVAAGGPRRRFTRAVA